MTRTPGRTILARAGWQRFAHDRRSMAELAKCPASEVRRIAQDVGVNERDLRTPRCNHPGPSELMPQRLWRLGVDPAYVEQALPATYGDLERVCATCGSWRRCSQDLANNDVQAGMDDYCLNALTIDMLTVSRPISLHAVPAQH
jgi:hypothetical protein